MSLVRRLPKRGFTNIHANILQELDLTYISSHFAEGETVCLESMRDKKLLKAAANGIVVLNNGELAHKVTVVADRISKGAREAILAAGGTIQDPPCAKQTSK
jgi:large subunit ribosomal protein L15